MADRYGYDRRTALRTLNLSATLQKTDRILTGNPRITVRVNTQNDHTFSRANNIHVGTKKLDLGNTEDLLAVMGMNYHEVSHVMFTPRMDLHELTWQKSPTEMIYLQPTFNFLEESRIETLFGAMYPKAKHFFTVMLVRVLLGKYEKPESVMRDEYAKNLGYTPEEAHAIYTHLLVYGRKYLPHDLRDAVREYAMDKVGSDRAEKQKLESAEPIIDEYRTLPTGKIRTRGKELAILLANLYPNFFMYVMQSDMGTRAHQPLNSGSDNDGMGIPTVRTNAPQETQQDAAEKAEQDEADGYEEIEIESDSDETEEDSEDWEEDDEDGSPRASDSDGDEDGAEDDDGDDSAPGSPQDAPGDSDTVSQVSGAGEGDDDAPGGSQGVAEGDQDGDATGHSAGVTTDATPQVSVPSIRDMAETIAKAISRDQKIRRDVEEVMDALDSPTEKSVDHYVSQKRYPESQEKEIAKRLGREFEKLAQEVSPGWEYGTDHGRLNVLRAMDPDADPDTIFDEWTEGRENDASVEMVILVDMSGSMMGPGIAGASSFSWTVAEALKEVDAKVTVYGFSNENELYVLRGRDEDHSEMVSEYKVVGGTSPQFALNAARTVLNQSEIPNRALVVMTDGQWAPNSVEWTRGDSIGQSYEPILSDVRAHKTLIGIGPVGLGQGGYFDDLAQYFDVASECESVSDLSEPILRTVEGIVRANVYR